MSIAATTAESFRHILQKVVQAADLVGRIDASGNEQTRASTEISSALGTLNQVTQRNAAAAEQLASSAQDLSTKAAAVENRFQCFPLGKDAVHDEGALRRATTRR